MDRAGQGLALRETPQIRRCTTCRFPLPEGITAAAKRLQDPLCCGGFRGLWSSRLPTLGASCQAGNRPLLPEAENRSLSAAVETDPAQEGWREPQRLTSQAPIFISFLEAESFVSSCYCSLLINQVWKQRELSVCSVRSRRARHRWVSFAWGDGGISRPIPVPTSRPGGGPRRQAASKHSSPASVPLRWQFSVVVVALGRRAGPGPGRSPCRISRKGAASEKGCGETLTCDHYCPARTQLTPARGFNSHRQRGNRAPSGFLTADCVSITDQAKKTTAQLLPRLIHGDQHDSSRGQAQSAAFHLNLTLESQHDASWHPHVAPPVLLSHPRPSRARAALSEGSARQGDTEVAE
ncbi:uncharacterized protein [Struthio camelus]|uniref:uncharacterized protein n=1 Tax=Struthio camelus TaxID=8801 RepID=UPI0036042BAB